ncbi:MAG: hypothetical protein JRI68_14495 [Deltaproteobacteria bacterium]|nr:hypothetical protein [Deltaproteobacteria bacterium]
MKRLLTATLLISFVAIGCGKDAQPLVDAAETYAKDSCACKDAACLTKAAKEYADATKKLTGEKLVPSEEQAEKMTEAAEKAVECNTKLTTKMATDAAAGAVPAAAPK